MTTKKPKKELLKRSQINEPTKKYKNEKAKKNTHNTPHNKTEIYTTRVYPKERRQYSTR